MHFLGNNDAIIPLNLLMLVNIVFVATAPNIYAGQLEHEEPKQSPGLTYSICGARCAHRVLELTGSRPELSEVLKEMHPVKTDAGVSLFDVKEYLKRKGVSCQAYQMPRNHWLYDQDYLAIAHVKAGLSNPEGHFVVVEPDKSDANKVIIWDGLLGSNEITCLDFIKTSTGAVLLINKSIADKHIVRTRNFHVIYWNRAFSATGMLLLSFFCGYFAAYLISQRNPRNEVRFF